MCEDLGGIVYDDAASLYPGAVFPETPSDLQLENSVRGILRRSGYGEIQDDYHTEETVFSNRKAPELEDENHRREAMNRGGSHMVSARIRELVGKEQVLDKETGACRPASYRDIVILLRTVSGWAETFQRVRARRQEFRLTVLPEPDIFPRGRL